MGEEPDAISPELRAQRDEFVRLRFDQIRRSVENFRRRRLPELDPASDLVERLVAETARELGQRFERSRPTDHDRFFQANVGNSILEARRQVDAQRDLHDGAGRMTRPKRDLVTNPPKWIQRAAPSTATREALLDLWYFAGGYGSDQAGIPYQRLEAKHGVAVDELDAALNALADRRPSWFERNYGSGLAARASRAEDAEHLTADLASPADDGVGTGLDTIDESIRSRVRSGASVEEAILEVVDSEVLDGLEADVRQAIIDHYRQLNS